ELPTNLRRIQLHVQAVQAQALNRVEGSLSGIHGNLDACDHLVGIQRGRNEAPVSRQAQDRVRFSIPRTKVQLTSLDGGCAGFLLRKRRSESPHQKEASDKRPEKMLCADHAPSGSATVKRVSEPREDSTLRLPL